MTAARNEPFSEPVAFFSAGPPCQGFFANGWSRPFCSVPPRRNNDRNRSLDIFPKIALVLLSVFALSMAFRVIVFLLETLLSPPVMAVCLLTLFVTHVVENSQPTFMDEFDVREFQRLFRNSQRFRRFFRMNRSRRGRPCNVTNNLHRAPGAPTNNANQEQQTSQQQPINNYDTTANDFQLVNILNLMAATMDLPEEESPVENADSSEYVHVAEEGTKHVQKVPLHREENDSSLMISMDISGFDISNIKISVENSTVCIRGERTNKIGDIFIIDEFFDIDKEQFLEDSITANASDGVLELKISKKKPPVPRIISITTEKKNEE
jgi:HSP20 family molecular chaperone IbpA